MEKFGKSQPVKRVEDVRFLTGHGRYIEDCAPAGALRAWVLRSPVAHGVISTLDLAEAQWGEMQFQAAGALEVDETGRLDGTLTVRAENWRAILEVAERLSLLPPSTRNAVEQILALFSSAPDSADVTGKTKAERINTTLRFRQGQMWAGPLPLGPAPRLILR